MTTALVNDADARFEAMLAERTATLRKMETGQPVTEREKVQFVFATMAESLARVGVFNKAMDEVQRVKASRKPKDIFKRVISLGMMWPDVKDKNVISAARADALKGYDDFMTMFDAKAALLAEQERLAAENKALSEAQAQRLEQLERECAAINATVAAGTAQPITVGKPLKLKP